MQLSVKLLRNLSINFLRPNGCVLFLREARFDVDVLPGLISVLTRVGAPEGKTENYVQLIAFNN